MAKTLTTQIKSAGEALEGFRETYGLVHIAQATRSGKRRVRVPQAMFDQIELKIAI